MAFHCFRPSFTRWRQGANYYVKYDTIIVIPQNLCGPTKRRLIFVSDISKSTSTSTAAPGPPSKIPRNLFIRYSSRVQSDAHPHPGLHQH
ncbi:hypothetical protein SCP_0900620 [Sparassis crispa]|uniref:Uncharacterized protein n=1 Tax=Sparassis crispa TaxID=139825 RepID=A0A401GWP0_9APHY|nr:hypothetical protein SCP_0900620 [Sparassis crispa]GBE86184.1 hypothetical protein SCP_0900620 [Sparassis crispa]